MEPDVPDYWLEVCQIKESVESAAGSQLSEGVRERGSRVQAKIQCSAESVRVPDELADEHKREHVFERVHSPRRIR